MAENNTKTIDIELSKLDQLVNVDAENIYPATGIESDAETYIYSEADQIRIKDTEFKLNIVIPKSEVTAENELLTKAVIKKFFAYRKDMAERELSRNFAQGRGAVVIASLFGAFCISISYFVSQLDISANWTSIINGILVIASWVAFWRPTELFLYDWWPLKRQIRVYERLSNMEVTFTHK